MFDRTKYYREYYRRKRKPLQEKWKGQGLVMHGGLRANIPAKWYNKTVEVLIRPVEYRTSHFTRRAKEIA